MDDSPDKISSFEFTFLQFEFFLRIVVVSVTVTVSVIEDFEIVIKIFAKECLCI